MGLFHVLWTVQMVPNHAKGHRLEDLEVSKVSKKESRTKSGEVTNSINAKGFVSG